mmetsp:Transcript_11296/g.15636  ORF Transcript_11296/g.15636 Transcript_11296/m.15636 type:complete len:134 (+) Transcript_11296:59-460(+)
MLKRKHRKHAIGETKTVVHTIRDIIVNQFILVSTVLRNLVIRLEFVMGAILNVIFIIEQRKYFSNAIFDAIVEMPHQATNANYQPQRKIQKMQKTNTRKISKGFTVGVMTATIQSTNSCLDALSVKIGSIRNA